MRIYIYVLFMFFLNSFFLSFWFINIVHPYSVSIGNLGLRNGRGIGAVRPESKHCDFPYGDDFPIVVPIGKVDMF